MSTLEFFISQWQFDPAAMAVAAIALAAYFLRFGWSGRAWFLLAAAAVFLLALVSPLAALARGYLFSAHMLQHILLMLVVSGLAMLALPPGMRLPRIPARLLNPVLCWAGGIGAMWVWHVPALCDAAAVSRPVFAFQSATLLALGAAFWWPILAPAEEQRISPLFGILYLFLGCTACSVLGVILTFSPVTVCHAYLNSGDRLGIGPLLRDTWGMTPLRDQQIGGLIMWVPMCLVYVGAILGQFARWHVAPAETRTTVS